MGVDLGEITPKRKISLEEIAGKKVAIDAYNALYQFLAIIRQPDGTPLKDGKGRITSHLSGLLYRTANFVEKGVRPAYVFDGEPPSLKAQEIHKRQTIKEAASARYEEALRRGELVEAKKYAQMTSRLGEEMVADAKRLLAAMGIPSVQAPSEGEAQASYMASQGDVWAAVSQDHDSLLFGAPRLVRNLTISGRRKLPGKEAYVEVEPEEMVLQEALSSLGVTREQLVDIGIMLGTDFNPRLAKGIGPKTALKLVKEHGRLEGVLKGMEGVELDFDLDEVREIFLKPRVTNDYRLEWKAPDVDRVVAFLCAERDFSAERVRNALSRMAAGFQKADRTTLESFFH